MQWEERTAATAAVAAEHAPAAAAPVRCAHSDCRKWPFSASQHGLCREHEQARQQRCTATHLATMRGAQPMVWPAAWEEREGTDAGAGGEEASGVDWGRVHLVQRLSGGEGSTGVFLVLLGPASDSERGGLLVVKPGSMYSATEVFCEMLYARLGIHVPRQRVVRNATVAGDEYDALCNGVLGAAFVEEEDRETAYHLLRPAYGERAFCTVSEAFFPGEPLGRLATLCPPPPLPPLPPVPPAAKPGEEGGNGEEQKAVEQERLQGQAEIGHPRALLMHELGVIMAADVLVNNGDRLPAIHRDRRHHGNPGNIIFVPKDAASLAAGPKTPDASTGGGGGGGTAAMCFTASAIDNTTTGISDPAGSARYLACVGDFAADIFSDGGGEGGGGVPTSRIPALAHAADFLAQHGGSAADGSDGEATKAFDRRHLRRGLATGMRHAGELLARNPLAAAELKRDVGTAFALRITIGTAGVRAGEGGEDSGMGLAWRGFELIKPKSIRDAANRMHSAAQPEAISH